MTLKTSLMTRTLRVSAYLLTRPNIYQIPTIYLCYPIYSVHPKLYDKILWKKVHIMIYGTVIIRHNWGIGGNIAIIAKLNDNSGNIKCDFSYSYDIATLLYCYSCKMLIMWRKRFHIQQCPLCVCLSMQHTTVRDGSVVGITHSRSSMLSHCRALSVACNYSEGCTVYLTVPFSWNMLWCRT